jgi:hypothetical protein
MTRNELHTTSTAQLLNNRVSTPMHSLDHRHLALAGSEASRTLAERLEAHEEVVTPVIFSSSCLELSLVVEVLLEVVVVDRERRNGARISNRPSPFHSWKRVRVSRNLSRSPLWWNARRVRDPG